MSIESVVRPYRAPCGHEILNCPECGCETNKRMGGEELKKYLIDKLGVPKKEADKLYKTRQIFHGSNNLTAEKNREIPDLTMLCWSLAAQAIKLATNQAPHPPFVARKAFGISHFYIGSRRAVADFESEWHN